MNNNDMKLNASGYTDYPCYNAMTKLGQPKAGEIWVHDKGAYMLVLSNVGGVCVTVRMNDVPRDEKSVQVTARVPMWINPMFLGYCFNTTLSQFVKVADKDEVEAVKDAIAVVLDLVADEREESEPEETAESTQASADDVSRAIDLEAKVESMELELAMAREQASKAEVYKEMYEQLLDRMLGRKN